MSNKRKRKASNKFRINHPREVGKFYKIADSKGGHPARIYYADVEKDTKKQMSVRVTITILNAMHHLV